MVLSSRSRRPEPGRDEDGHVRGRPADQAGRPAPSKGVHAGQHLDASRSDGPLAIHFRFGIDLDEESALSSESKRVGATRGTQGMS